MVDWELVRKDFPITQNITYFQSAGTSPLPTPVYEAVLAGYRQLRDFGDINWHKDFVTFRQLLDNLATMIHTTPDNLTFVANTSTAMSLLALAMKPRLADGGNIVSLQDEFPATTVPFEYQKITMKYVQPTASRYAIKAILEQVDAQTLAVVVSYVQYCTGFRLNLTELGAELRARKVYFIVNATQAMPMFPLDVMAMNIDAMSASLHKWGCAGHVGALFYTTPAFRAKFPAPIAGWLAIAGPGDGSIHTQKNVPFALHASADQYWPGTINFQPFRGLAAAFDYLTHLGFDQIRTRLWQLSDYLVSGLRQLPSVTIVSPLSSHDERSAIVSFTLGEKTDACVPYLAERQIYASYRNGYVRIAVNIFNNERDIDRLLTAIGELVAAPQLSGSVEPAQARPDPAASVPQKKDGSIGMFLCGFIGAGLGGFIGAGLVTIIIMNLDRVIGAILGAVITASIGWVIGAVIGLVIGEAIGGVLGKVIGRK